MYCLCIERREWNWDGRGKLQKKPERLHCTSNASHVNNLLEKNQASSICSTLRGSTSTPFLWEAVSACLRVCLKPLEKHPSDLPRHQWLPLPQLIPYRSYQIFVLCCYKVEMKIVLEPLISDLIYRSCVSHKNTMQAAWNSHFCSTEKKSSWFYTPFSITATILLDGQVSLHIYISHSREGRERQQISSNAVFKVKRL